MTANEGNAGEYYRSVGLALNLTGVGTLAVAVVGPAQVGLGGQVYLSSVAAALGATSAIFITLAARARRHGANPNARWKARLARRPRATD